MYVKYFFGLCFLVGTFKILDSAVTDLVPSGGGKNVRREVYYVAQRYKKKCGSFGWRRCTRYRSIARVRYPCYTGWRSNDGRNCLLAICDGKTNVNAACHRTVAPGNLIKPDGTSVTFSKGSCYAPQKCNSCEKGFYAKNGGPYCELCPQIANCDYEECGYSPGFYKICTRCNGDYGMNPHRDCHESKANHSLQVHGCSAFYFNDPQTRTACVELCSWRSTSTSCWPGECGPKGYKTDCKCHPWFSGKECLTIVTPPNIVEAGVQLDQDQGGGKYKALAHNDPNKVNITRVYWTNAKVSHATVRSKADWTPRLPGRPAYVSKDRKETDIGIVLASVTITSTRANGTEQNDTFPVCGGQTYVNDPAATVSCNVWTPLADGSLQHVYEHGASLEFEITYTAGGFLTIIDLDRGMNNKTTKHVFEEATSTYKTTFKWDLVKPYSDSTDYFSLSTAKATSIGQTITATWRGWTDPDAKVTPEGTVGVKELTAVKGKNNEEELQDHCGGNEKKVTLSEGKTTFTVTKPGVYAVTLTVPDFAGNHERARQFFTYDPSSKPEIKAGTSARFTSAASSTSFQWQHDLDKPVVFENSRDRYINPVHVHGHWLGAIRPCPGVGKKYDAIGGLRTRAAIRNNEGIVKLERGYLKYRTPSRPSTPVVYKPYDIFSTTASFTIPRQDGDTVELFTKVTDYMGRTFTETNIVRFDSTPPVINNFWLTRDGAKRLAVHNSNELKSLTCEWDAYDYHTGLKNVEWTIFDNHTNNKEVIFHGYQKYSNQGGYKSLDECKRKHFEVGPDCYKTPYHGFHHKHFIVKPQVAANNGLHPARKDAPHEHDLFVKVTVINWANLITTSIIKITIDISPPSPGFVNEGMPGNPDVAFQGSTALTGHWGGFVDHESGIQYYQYVWGTKCADASVFGIKYDNSKVTKTTLTSSKWNAPSTGKYFLTVVAFNAALDHSVPVCSNGVVVDDTAPVMGGLAVENTITKPGLVKQAGKVYYVGKDRRKVLIEKPSAACIKEATQTNDVSIYLDATFPNGKIKTETTKFCEKQNPLSLTVPTPMVVDRYISANFTAQDPESGIATYHFGLMSSKGASAAPDILPYQDTKHSGFHTYKSYHPGLTAGKVFYIGIKATNKVSLSSEKVFGPFVVEVTPPTFSGKINTEAKAVGQLTARWKPGDFADAEGDLTYTFCVGTSAGGTEVASWTPLLPGGDCKATNPPSCTTIPTKTPEGIPRLHPGDDYYISVKATNYVGLFVVGMSAAVKLFTDTPTLGVVHDVAPESERLIVTFGRPDDVDYQRSTSSLEVWWSGFDVPFHRIEFKASVGTTPYGSDVAAARVVTGSTYKFEGLTLKPFKVYYTTVFAKNVNGEVKVSSDGVMVLDAKASLQEKKFYVYDGLRTCSTSPSCKADIDAQVSTSTMSVHWVIPKDMEKYVTHAYWKIEEKSDIVDSTSWKTFAPFVLVSKSAHDQTRSNVGLNSGKYYRNVIQWCHGTVCFDSIHSNGVIVLAKPPLPKSLSLQYQEPKTINVVFDRFFTADIPRHYQTESWQLTNDYYWAVTTNEEPGQHISGDWTKADVKVKDTSKGEFSVVLPHPLAFKECYRFALRGVSKSGLGTTISKEIKPCDGLKPYVPTVIDAYGTPEIDEATKKPIPTKGTNIKKDKNKLWPYPDKDFTPYNNILSATWPRLRHKKYKFAVISDPTLSAFSHSKRPDKMIYKDPCAAPTAEKCGTTENEYVNVEMTLEHGKRYYICVHADSLTIKHEKWTETLEEVNSCSDGITADLTDPKPGKVWIGSEKEQDAFYLTSNTELDINWSEFVDVEERGKSPYKTGIKSYAVAVGSYPGYSDIVGYQEVGLVTKYVAQGLSLQDGHTYYATVRGTDYVGRSATATSPGVMIDTTPPLKTSVNLDNRFTTSKKVELSFEGLFYDKESGISHYEWYIGSQPGYADVMPKKQTTQTRDVSDELSLHEGHVYYVSVTAINRAGLHSMATDWPKTYDASPPTKGHVFDGRRDQATAEKKDQDYQKDASTISAYWEGFSDQHSGIASYSWSIGTCPRCSDVIREHPVGTMTEATVANLATPLRQGKTYYVTVTACNGVGMCTSATSDGVLIDTTPPIKGLVQDGVGVFDMDYQSSRTYVGAKWWGIQDPQSGIDYYSWWVGTTPGGDDLMKEERLHHSEMVYRLELPGGRKLPVGKPIYTTIKATNRVGLTTTATSNGFQVAVNPPRITKPVTHIDTLGSVYKNTQVMKTVFGVTWQFDDTTPIMSQYLHVFADGGFHRDDMPTVRLDSTINKYYVSNVTLHDGTWYRASVTACNQAKLCTTSTSSKVLVDNSPPHTGAFAIDTEHAAALKRQEAGHFTWTANSLTFSVLAFADIHSGIKHYDVSVGSTYGNRDITKAKVVRFNHGSSSWKRDHEGMIQKFTLDGTKITGNLKAGMEVYILVTAINGVGLKSTLRIRKFRLLSGGEIAMLRRCKPEHCEGHCVCSPHKAWCPMPTIKCLEKSSQGLNLDVYDINDIRENASPDDVDFSPSTCMLAARWSVSTSSTVKPVGFDVAFGLTSETAPSGLKRKDNIVWEYVGLDTQAIHTRGPHDDFLVDSAKYSFFIRAWTSETEYKIFKSNGVVPAIRSPARSTKLAAAVKDCRRGDNKKGTAQARDVDSYNRKDYFCVSWKNAFQERTASHVERHYVSLSSFAGGEDIVSFKPYPPTASFAEFNNLKLTGGRRYYSNVRLCNKAGLCTTSSSDGALIDVDPPIAGNVFDGIGLHDEDYQNRTNLVSAFWDGFVDLGSSIHHYTWCVGNTKADSECSILPWTNVGLKSRMRKVLASKLKPGRIYSKVYAMDAAGHKSTTVVSDGTVVDLTSPVVKTKLKFGGNIISNPSFEEVKGVKLTTISTFTKQATLQVPKGWKVKDGHKTTTVDEPALAKNGKQFLVLYGSVSQTVTGLKVGSKYIVIFYSSHIHKAHSPAAEQRGEASLPDGQKYGFKLRDRTRRHDASGSSQPWNKHIFYFYASSTSGDLTISSVGERNGIAIDDVSMQLVQDGVSSQTDGYKADDFKTPIHVHGVFTSTFSTLDIGWDIEDEESPLVDVKLAVGTKKAGSELYGYKSVGVNTFAHIPNLDVRHGSSIYVTFIAWNAAGLFTSLLSDPIMVDMTPPVFEKVWDGHGTNGDDDFQDSSTVKAQWVVNDKESGVQYCEYGIGTTPVSPDVQSFTKVPSGTRRISHPLTQTPIPPRLYTIIRCYNYAGSSATMATDGVAVSNSKPNSKNAWVKVLTGSPTVYPNHRNASGSFQSSKDRLFLKWAGFEDLNGILRYEVNVHDIGKTGPIWDQWIRVPSSAMKYMSITNLGMSDGGKYRVAVRAVNAVGRKSDKVTTDVTINGQPPQLNNKAPGNKPELFWVIPNKKFIMKWGNVFRQETVSSYEVSLGTVEGGADIKQWQETTSSEVTFELETAWQKQTTFYATITAVNHSGLYTYYNYTINKSAIKTKT